LRIDLGPETSTSEHGHARDLGHPCIPVTSRQIVESGPSRRASGRPAGSFVRQPSVRLAIGDVGVERRTHACAKRSSDPSEAILVHASSGLVGSISTPTRRFGEYQSSFSSSRAPWRPQEVSRWAHSAPRTIWVRGGSFLSPRRRFLGCFSHDAARPLILAEDRIERVSPDVSKRPAAPEEAAASLCAGGAGAGRALPMVAVFVMTTVLALVSPFDDERQVRPELEPEDRFHGTSVL